jgi:hypothetical protein
MAMLATVAVPAIIVLWNLPAPPAPPAGARVPDTRFGYTISLLFFILPTVILSIWYFRSTRWQLERSAFWRTALLGFGTASLLDVVFGNTFFKFQNLGATLGLRLPGFAPGQGLVPSIPIEEFLFYAFGFTTILLIYVWGNEYWFAAYRRDLSRDNRIPGGRLAQVDPASAGVVLAAIVLAVVYKKLGPHPYHAGVPGYFAYLALSAGFASLFFFPVARGLINWRAMSLTLFVLLFLSLLWEVTLGVPNSWWDYRDEQMLGVRIAVWDRLPIEAVLVWVSAVWGTIIVYEVVRLYRSTDLRARRAFLGIGDERPRGRRVP